MVAKHQAHRRFLLAEAAERTSRSDAGQGVGHAGGVRDVDNDSPQPGDRRSASASRSSRCRQRTNRSDSGTSPAAMAVPKSLDAPITGSADSPSRQPGPTPSTVWRSSPMAGPAARPSAGSERSSEGIDTPSGVSGRSPQERGLNGCRRGESAPGVQLQVPSGRGRGMLGP